MRSSAKLALVIGAAIVILAILYGVRTGLLSYDRAPKDAPSENATSTDDAWVPYRGGIEYRGTNVVVGFRFYYPPDFGQLGAEDATGNFMGRPLTEVRFPENAFAEERTNFGGAGLTLSLATSVSEVAKCYEHPRDPNTELTTTETVNGIIFHTGTVTEGAAGSRYDSRIYRTKHKGGCYELALTVRTANIGNFEPGTVTEFAPDRAWGTLDKMLRTFVFLTPSVTPGATSTP